MSRLVSSEIVSQTSVQTRVGAIEKFAAVADICKCFHNFNGVLQVSQNSRAVQRGCHW